MELFQVLPRTNNCEPTSLVSESCFDLSSDMLCTCVYIVATGGPPVTSTESLKTANLEVGEAIKTSF